MSSVLKTCSNVPSMPAFSIPAFSIFAVMLDKNANRIPASFSA